MMSYKQSASYLQNQFYQEVFVAFSLAELLKLYTGLLKYFLCTSFTSTKDGQTRTSDFVRVGTRTLVPILVNTLNC